MKRVVKHQVLVMAIWMIAGGKPNLSAGIMKARFALNVGANMNDMTEVEQELLQRYLSGEINETQFNFLINHEGLDKERMLGFINKLKSDLDSLAIFVTCVLGMIVVLAVSCLMKLITPL